MKYADLLILNIQRIMHSCLPYYQDFYWIMSIV